MMITVTYTLRMALQTYLEYESWRARRVRHPVLRRARTVRLLLWISFAGLALFACIAPPAHAAFALFDPLVNQVQGESANWFTSIQGVVRPTFLLLGTLEICWAAAIWAFEKDSLNSLSIEIIKKIMFHGFFYAVLLYAQDWIPAITSSFEAAGERATGAPAISTDKIIQMGLDVIGTIWSQTIAFVFPIVAFDPEEILGTANPASYAALALGEAQYMLAAVATVIIAFAYCVVAAQYFTLKLESYVLFAAGAIFLGMGSNSFTKEYVTKYLNYAINVGIRLLVLILILSITLESVSKMGAGFAFDYKALLGVMAAGVLQAILAIKAPDMAGALMNGSPGLTAGGVFNTALNTIAQARLAGGGAAGGARAAAAGGGHNGGGGGGPGGPGSGATGPRGLGDAIRASQNPMNQQPQDRSSAAETLEGLGGRPAAREMVDTRSPVSGMPGPQPTAPASLRRANSTSPVPTAGHGRPGPSGPGESPHSAASFDAGESALGPQTSAEDLPLSTALPPNTRPVTSSSSGTRSRRARKLTPWSYSGPGGPPVSTRGHGDRSFARLASEEGLPPLQRTALSPLPELPEEPSADSPTEE